MLNNGEAEDDVELLLSQVVRFAEIIQIQSGELTQAANQLQNLVRLQEEKNNPNG